MATPVRSVGMFGLLRRPAPRLIWVGQVASVAGDRLYSVALIWVTLQLTGSPAAVAAVSVADTVPFLLAGVVSGWVADRHDSLRLARVVDLARAGVVAVIPMLYLAGQLSVPALGLVAIALSALEAFFLPALQAALPRLVEPAALTAMVSLLDSTDRLGRVLGPGMVGLLVLLPEVHLFTLDAASFLISAACLNAALRHTDNTCAFRSVARSERLGGTALLAGWKSILAHAALRDALVLRGVCNLAWPAFTLTTPFLVAHRYQHGVGGYGLVLAVFGGGNLIGTVFAARVADRWLFRTCCLAWAGAGLGFLGLAGAPTYLLFLTGAAAIGVCTPLANVTVNAAVATTVPPHLLARAYTAQRITVVGASVLGLPLAAAITSGPGPTTALNSAGVLILGAAMLAIATTARNPGAQEPRLP